MNINSQLEKLFDQWIAEGLKNREWQSEENIVFTKDGILEKNNTVEVETQWLNSTRRILFIIKDQPTLWNDDLRLWLKDLPEDDVFSLRRKADNRELKPRFIRNIANVLYGLYNAKKPEDCDFHKVAQSLGQVKWCFNNVPFALIEGKKQGGGTILEDKILKHYLYRYKELIRSEMEILSPNIIVCTNKLIYDFVIDFLNEKYPDESVKSLLSPKHNSVRFHLGSKTIILNSFHPSARISYKNFYDGVMDHFKAFLESEYSWIS